MIAFEISESSITIDSKCLLKLEASMEMQIAIHVMLLPNDALIYLSDSAYEVKQLLLGDIALGISQKE